MTDSRLEKLHITISLLAALLVTVVCLVRQEGLYRMSVWVAAAIIVFYVLGQIVRIYLMRKVFPPPAPVVFEEGEPAEEETPAPEKAASLEEPAYAEDYAEVEE